MRLTYSLEIRSSPQGVWYWLGDPERAKVWQTGVGETRILRRAPDWIGTTFTEVVRDDSGSTEMRGVVTDYRENEALAMHLEGDYDTVDVSWSIEPVGQHTRLTQRSDIRFKGFLRVMSILMRPVFRKKILSELRAECARLRGLCEKVE